MGESARHRELKRKAAANSGKTEVKPAFKKKSMPPKVLPRATEVERSGDMRRLVKAAKRLKESGKPQKVLEVPQKDLKKAVEAMKKAGVLGTVRNLSGTQRRYLGVEIINLKPKKSSKKDTYL